jgi:hypothetical protein
MITGPEARDTRQMMNWEAIGAVGGVVGATGVIASPI